MSWYDMVCHHSPEMSWKYWVNWISSMFSSLKPSMVGIITPASSATVAGKPKLGSMNCKRPQGEQKIPLKDLKRPSHPRKVNNSSHSPHHQRAPLFGAPSSWLIYIDPMLGVWSVANIPNISQLYPAAKGATGCPKKTTCYANPPDARPAFCKDFEDVPVAGPACPGSSGAVCSFICFPEREGSDLVGQVVLPTKVGNCSFNQNLECTPLPWKTWNKAFSPFS